MCKGENKVRLKLELKPELKPEKQKYTLPALH
jgi:hypothetical protein